MPDVAKRLYGPNVLQTSSTLLYTVPSGITTIIRSIHVVNSSTSSFINFSMSINGSATTVSNQIFSSYPLAGQAIMDWSGFMVLTANESIYANANVGNQMTVVISGVEVS